VLACIGIAAAFLGITIWANIITRQTEVKDSGVQTTPAGNPVGTAKVIKKLPSIANLATTEAGMREVFEVETYTFQRMDNFSYHMKVTDRMVNSDFSNVTLFGDRGISVQITRSSSPYAAIKVTDPTDAERNRKRSAAENDEMYKALVGDNRRTGCGQSGYAAYNHCYGQPVGMCYWSQGVASAASYLPNPCIDGYVTACCAMAGIVPGTVRL